MIDNDLTDSYWWSDGDYDWIEIDMGVSQPVGRIFVNFGWWWNTGCPFSCTNTKYATFNICVTYITFKTRSILLSRFP